jgi:hypothetical protein
MDLFQHGKGACLERLNGDVSVLQSWAAMRRHCKKCNTTHHNTTQHNTTQHNTIRKIYRGQEDAQNWRLDGQLDSFELESWPRYRNQAS